MLIQELLRLKEAPRSKEDIEKELDEVSDRIERAEDQGVTPSRRDTQRRLELQKELAALAKQVRESSDPTYTFRAVIDDLGGDYRFGDVHCEVIYRVEEDEDRAGKTVYDPVIEDIIATKDIKEIDEDGKVIRTIPSGTSLFKDPGVSAEDEAHFLKLCKKDMQEEMKRGEEDRAEAQYQNQLDNERARG